MIKISQKELEILATPGTNQSTIVIFFADWCSPSLLQINDIENSLLEQKFKDKPIGFYKINIENALDLVEKFQTHTLPCMLLFVNGELVERIYGYQQLEYIEAYTELLLEELERKKNEQNNNSSQK